LEEAVSAPHFPEADLLLRRGRHVHQDDGELYAFLRDAQDFLEPLYRRFGCELVHVSDGYFYLMPVSDQLPKRLLGPGEMLVGQTLALLYRDPETLRTAGVVPRVRLLERLRQLVGETELIHLLSPRKRRFDSARAAEQMVRDRVADAVNTLNRLGFLTVEGDANVRLLPPIHRFAEPVRSQGDPQEALERLIRSGRIAMADDESDTSEDVEP